MGKKEEEEFEEDRLLDKAIALIDEAEKLAKDYKFSIRTDVLLSESPYDKVIANYKEAQDNLKKIGWNNEANSLINTIKFYRDEKVRDDKLRGIEQKKLEEAQIKAIPASKDIEKDLLMRKKRVLEFEKQKRENTTIAEEILKKIKKADDLVKDYEAEIRKKNFEAESPYKRVLTIYQNARKEFEEIGWIEESMKLLYKIQFYKQKFENFEKIKILEPEKVRKRREEILKRPRSIERASNFELFTEKNKAFELTERAKEELERNNFQRAIELYKESEKIFSKIGWQEGINMVQDSITMIKRKEKSLKLQQEAIKKRKQKEVKLEAQLEEKFVQAEELRKHLQEEKRREFLKIQSEKQWEKEISDQAYKILEQGTALLDKKRFNEAYEKYIEARKLFSKISWKREVSRINNDLLFKLRRERKMHEALQDIKKKRRIGNDDILREKDEQISILKNSLEVKKETEKKLKNTIDELERIIQNSYFKDFLLGELQNFGDNDEILRESKQSNLNISTNLNNKDRIVLLLKSEELTSSELATKLGLSKQDTRTYLLRLKKENRVRVVAKKGRFNLYTAKPYVVDEKYLKRINVLEYDLSYLINLLEVKMRLKEGESFTQVDTINITRIKDKINEKKEEILGKKETNQNISTIKAKNNIINDTSFEVKSWEEEFYRAFFITLTYFNRRIGPTVFYSYPISITDEDLIEKIASIMDLLTSEQFVTIPFDNYRSLNYYFEIESTWARGEKEILLLSAVFQESVSIEKEKAILTLCIEFSEWLKGKDNIFKGFYQHDPKYYQTHSKTIDDTALEVKSWVEEFYKAVSEVVKEKITAESISSFIEKENVLETLKFISIAPVSLEKLREWYTSEYPKSNIYKLMIDLIKNRMITIPTVGKSGSPPFRVYISEDIKKIINLIDLKKRLLKRFKTASQNKNSITDQEHLKNFFVNQGMIMETENFFINQAIKKVEHIMEAEHINEITIKRDYLLEIFNKRMLEISDDGYPTLAPWTQTYFLDARIFVKILGNIIKFTKLSPKHDQNKKSTVKCEGCGYIIARPFPKDYLCPSCGKFLPGLFDLTKDKDNNEMEKLKARIAKRREERRGRIASILREKEYVKPKTSDIKIYQLGKDEYIKLLGVTSVERAQLYSSNEDLRYLLELTNNLDFIATGILGGELHKMLLISVEDDTYEKCQFHVKDGIIYIAYGNFPDKKGKWLLEQMSNNFAELINGQDVDNLDKLEKHRIENEFKRRIKYIITEYRELQEVFTDEEIPYVEDSIRIDYLGLSSMSIGIISLLTGEDLDIQLQMKVESPEEEIEMKESMLAARIEAIAANTQGNTGAVPRWISVKLGFQRFRFLTFKKYQNNYFLSLLSEGNLEKLEDVEKLLDKEINNVIHTEFSGDLKPFNELKSRLNRKLHKRNKFPPFEFDDEIDDNEINIKKEISRVRKNCRYCGSKLEISDEFCSNCGTKID